MGTTWNTEKGNKDQAKSGGLKAASKSAGQEMVREKRGPWTRADKIGAVACLVLLAVLLIVSACSKQDTKQSASTAPSSAAISGAAATVASMELSGTAAGTASLPVTDQPAAPAKKSRRKQAANVNYSDENSGVSFVYPRKFELASSGKAAKKVVGEDGAADEASGDELGMNFVEAGGSTVTTVSMPEKLYPGTDFSGSQFRVNVNRNLSADQCSHFAFMDTSEADGEPIDSQKVKVGETEMQKTSSFEGNAVRQVETRYYHNYQNGACYEYVLGLQTAGFGEEGVKAVDRDEVFGRLEKILSSVKVSPVEQLAEQQDESKQDAAKQQAEQPAARDSER